MASNAATSSNRMKGEVDMADTLKIAIPAPVKTAAVRYANYFNALAALGAQPEAVEADCDPANYDGLLLPGGEDVSPQFYHQENIACEDCDPALDALQLAVLDAFVRAGKPVFGICRGHQLLNVYFGGTLIQNIHSRARHARDAGSNQDKVHASAAVPGELIDRLYGRELYTNSSHHQAVDVLGAGLRVVQRSDDGFIEAMVHESLPIFSVQWHPERMCFAFARPDTVDGAVVFAHFLSLSPNTGHRA